VRGEAERRDNQIVVKALVESDADIIVSVSSTTRAMRPGEEDGLHYNFLSQAAFRERLEAGDFLEHAQVFDNYYGTSGVWVTERLEQGVDVILEIDWQGARQVREAIPSAISIFILPPSHDELERRLRGRAQDSDTVIQRRMRDAKAEIAHFGEFDYLVVNDDFQKALAELQSIVTSRRLLQATQADRYGGLLQSLLQ